MRRRQPWTSTPPPRRPKAASAVARPCAADRHQPPRQAQRLDAAHVPAAGRGLYAPGRRSRVARGRAACVWQPFHGGDRKSTRLNSSHQIISYAVFCLKTKENTSELPSLHHHVCRLLLDKETPPPL